MTTVEVNSKCQKIPIKEGQTFLQVITSSKVLKTSQKCKYVVPKVEICVNHGAITMTSEQHTPKEGQTI